MGVPGFFAWLLRNYKSANIVTTEITGLTLDTVTVDVLYLDANCLIHPQCFKVLAAASPDISEPDLELKMREQIIKYIMYLVDYVDPHELYIAVDGVAPMAKMCQQRKRRFRGVDDAVLRDKIKDKYNIPKTTWTNAVITPGTEFMEALHQRLEQLCETMTIPVTYSSYHTPGEGEHKILQDIKQRPECVSVIYGLDADLIFLALASQRTELFLLREATEFGETAPGLNYVSIDNLRQCINEMTRNPNFTPDFIFICYFLGNDFLPHLPSIDIKRNGLNLLIDCYNQLYENISLLTDGEVNMAFLMSWISLITAKEHYYFTNILNTPTTTKIPDLKPYELEIWELEHLIYVKQLDLVKLGTGSPEEYKYRYYNYYFGVCEHTQNIDEICHEYLKTISWVTQYYFKKCESYEYQYPYTHAPFLSDILSYLQRNKIDMDKLKPPPSSPLSPFLQLLAVLPPQYSRYLPLNWREVMTNPVYGVIDMYPLSTSLDTLHKDMLFQCVPMIPTVDIARLREAVVGLKLTNTEKTRNQVREPLIKD